MIRAEEILAVASLVSYAEKHKKSVDEVFEDWCNLADGFFSVKRGQVHRASNENKAVADKLYVQYPKECLNPTKRRIAKSPDNDIPAILKLLDDFGEERVCKAFDALIAKGAYLPDLCRAIKQIRQILSDEDYSSKLFQPQDNRPDF